MRSLSTQPTYAERRNKPTPEIAARAPGFDAWAARYRRHAVPSRPKMLPVHIGSCSAELDSLRRFAQGTGARMTSPNGTHPARATATTAHR
jgi:hypothetical protein